MAGDLLAPPVGLVYNRAQFFDRQRGLRDQFAVLTHPGTVRHVDLDPVGAMIELFPRRLTGFDWTIGDLRSLGHFKLRRVTLQGIASSSRNRPRGYQQARPRNISAIDRLLDSHVAVSRTLGLDIAQGGESLCERPPCRDRCPRRS